MFSQQIAIGSAIACLALITSAHDDESAVGKKCILAAAIKLPTVPGIEITATRTAPSSKPDYLGVTIKFDAAKQHFTAKFDCLNTSSGQGSVAQDRGRRGELPPLRLPSGH